MADELTVATATFFAGGISLTAEETEMNVITPEYHQPETRHVFVDTVTGVDVDVDIVDTTQSVSYNVPGTLHIYANNQTRETTSPAYNFRGTEFSTGGLRAGDAVTRCSLSSTGASTAWAGSWPINISNASVNNPFNYNNIVYHNGTFTVTEPPQPSWGGGGDGGGDPLAQSFSFNEDFMVTCASVFFESVDTSAGDIWCQIRPMKDGLPTNKVLGEAKISSADVKVSDDSSEETRFTFTYPIFIKSNEDYCVVVGGGSPASRVWSARMGEKRVDMFDSVYEDGYSGVSFRSQNASTWTPEQAEDIKFTIYGAEFTADTMNLVFHAEVEREKLVQDPFEVEAGVKKVRVHINSHGLNTGDAFDVSVQEDVNFKMSLSATPAVGQSIMSKNGNAIVSEVAATGNGSYDVKMKNIQGYIRQNDAVTLASYELKSSDGAVVRMVPEINGSVTWAPYHTYNGVDLAELNGTLVVSDVDSIDSVIVDIESVPQVSGRFGGTAVHAQPNIRFEIFNISGEREKYTCDESWSYLGVQHNVDDGPFENINNTYAPEKQITLKTDYHLDTPYKVLNSPSEKKTGLIGARVGAAFKSPSKHVSPVINTSTFNMTVVTNRVQIEDAATQDVAPSGAGRHVPETHSSQGTCAYKYVTKKITLANPASDARIMIDVYKDFNADFDVYVRVREQYVNEDISTYDWVKLSIPQKKNSVNLIDTMEYELNLSECATGLPDQFIEFQIKLVGESSNPAKPPFFKNLRAVAFT